MRLEGPELEIKAWNKILQRTSGNQFSEKPSFPNLEKKLKKQIVTSDPPGWKEQPLYKNEIIRRIIRGALMHYNLSVNKLKILCKFRIQPNYQNFVLNKFPNRPEFKLYQAWLVDRKVYFIGTIDINQSISVYGLYEKSQGGLNYVSNLSDLVKLIGVKETQTSRAIIFAEVNSFLNFEKFKTKTLQNNIKRWLKLKKIRQPRSIPDLINKLLQTLPLNIAACELNYFLEGTMTARHSGQHAYLNELEEKFRASQLKPVQLFSVDLPIKQIRLKQIGIKSFLTHKNKTTLFLHPTSIPIIKKIAPHLLEFIKKEYVFYPTVGSRSGYLKKNNRWCNYQIKFDLFKILSGWYRLCGTNAVNEEVEAAKFLNYFLQIGVKPPNDLILWPTNEGFTYKLRPSLFLATLAREIPKNLHGEILIPAAYLYTTSPFSQKTLLEELFLNKSIKEMDFFFRNILITPIMSAWNYFLSLENKKTHIWGLAYEMHGANFYYIYDRQNSSLSGKIVVKDFASNRILYNSLDKQEQSQEWLINEFDYSLGHLHLNPLIKAMSTITGKQVGYYTEIIKSLFIKLIKPKNKVKFLVNTQVISSHEDVYEQLSNFQSPREKTWVSFPKFRPFKVADYYQ